MTKLFIATPMYGGQCYGYYAQSVLMLQKTMEREGIETVFSFMFNESLITRARNALTHGFLNSDATHLLFIDSDIRFNPEDVIAMLKADKEVICGMYPKKEINFASVKRGIEAEVQLGVEVQEHRLAVQFRDDDIVVRGGFVTRFQHGAVLGNISVV